MTATLTRRTVLAGTGALVVGFALRAAPATAAAPESGVSGGANLAGSLKKTPMLDSWIRVEATGRVEVLTGKAELGQGIATAFVQIAAEELDLPLDAVTIRTADTGTTPDEGYTAGSHSIQDSGSAIRAAAAEVRRLLVGEAAARWSIPVAGLRTEGGGVAAPDGRRFGYGELVSATLIHVAATPDPALKAPADYTVVDRPVKRLDIPAKVTGGPRLRAGHASPGPRPCPRGATAGLRRNPPVDRRRGRAGDARRRRGRAGRILSRGRGRDRVGRHRGDAAPRRRGAMVGAGAIAGRTTRGRDRQDAAVARHDDPLPRHAPRAGRAAPFFRRLHATLPGARLDRPVLRRGAPRRRRHDRVDPHAGRLSGPGRDRRDAARGAAARALHPRAGFRLLRPQWRRRCRGRRRAHRPRPARPARAGPADARAGGGLGTVRPRHGDPRASRARR